jgi:hypothetical protein
MTSADEVPVSPSVSDPLALAGTRFAETADEAIMVLRLCILRARPGREAAVRDRLRHAVSRPGHGEETSLLLCGTDDPGEFVWMGSLAAETRPGPAPISVVQSVASDLMGPAPVLSLRFVGGWHRLPAPPYHIWNVEIRGSSDLPVDSVTALLVPPGAGGAEPVVGRSVFRAVEEAALFIGFVGLTSSWLRHHPVPRHAGARGAVALWRPLSVLYRAETFPGGIEKRPLGSLWQGVAPASLAATVGVSS